MQIEVYKWEWQALEERNNLLFIVSFLIVNAGFGM